jgi:hypothetical protein
MCGHGDEPAGDHRFFDGVDGARTADLQGHHIAWKDDHVSKREQRDPIGRVTPRLHA